MAAIKNLCTRAVLLTKGTIVADGKPADVIDYYLKNTKVLSDKGSGVNTSLRKGNGKFQVTNIEFLNERMEEVTVLESGMNLTICVRYQCFEKGVNPVVNIIIKNNLQLQVVNLLSRIAHSGVMKLKEEGSIICHIPKLPLMAGRYSIDILLKYDFELTDEVEDIVIIDVEKGDFYGTGKIIDSMRNGVLVYHTWQAD